MKYSYDAIYVSSIYMKIYPQRIEHYIIGSLMKHGPKLNSITQVLVNIMQWQETTIH